MMILVMMMVCVCLCLCKFSYFIKQFHKTLISLHPILIYGSMSFSLEGGSFNKCSPKQRTFLFRSRTHPQQKMMPIFTRLVNTGKESVIFTAVLFC